MSTRTWQILWFALVAVFVFVGLRPSDTPPPPGHTDLVGHAAINLVLGGIAYKAFASPRALLVALVGLAVVGGVIELLQSFSPNREPSIADFVADLVGIVSAGGAATLLARR